MKILQNSRIWGILTS